MKVISFQAENYKKLRAVEIVPKGNIVQITGKTSQGKTSVIDALWAGIVGKRATADRPVRKGAEKAKIAIGLGEKKIEVWVRRAISANGLQQLDLEYVNPAERPLAAADGGKATPQKLLDDLFSELAFDPIAFIRMPTKSKDKAVTSKLDILRGAVKLDVDLDKMELEDNGDREQRTEANKEAKRLDAILATYTILANLPEKKLDEAAILKQLSEAGEINARAQQADAAKRDAAAIAEGFGRDVEALKAEAAQTAQRISLMREQLKQAEEHFDAVEARRERAAEAFEAATLHAARMPAANFADVSSLAEQLKIAQDTNREIAKRDSYNVILRERDAALARSAALTRQMEARAEKRQQAFENAKLPVPGLTFDEEGVLLHGLPLEQAGGAEQIRASTALAMAMNKKLRILRIDNGESMDEDDMAVIAQMAKEHDYQLWITRVDSSGKVGIVIEDGEVKTVNEEGD